MSLKKSAPEENNASSEEKTPGISLKGVENPHAGRDNNFFGDIVQKVFTFVFKPTINVVFPFNSQHGRFIRYVAVSSYVTLIVGGLIKLWMEGYASPFTISLLITGSVLLVLTCFYYVFFWKPFIPEQSKPPIEPIDPENVRFFPDPKAEDPERDQYRYLAERQKYREEYERERDLRQERKEKYKEACRQHEQDEKQRNKILKQVIARRCTAAILMVVIPLSAFAGFWAWWKTPINTLVTFAEYYGSDPAQVNDLTGNIREKLGTATHESGEKDITIKYIGRAFSHSERDEAIREGERRKATIAIWGWYFEKTKFKVNTIFELLKSSLVVSISDAAKRLGVEDADWSHYLVSLEEVDADIESDTANEMGYLVNFTSGLAHYKAEIWQRAIDRFNDALKDIERIKQPESTLNQSIVYFYRSNAYFYKSYFSGQRSGYDSAIDGFTKAIELIPESSLSFHNQDTDSSTHYHPRIILADYKVSQVGTDINETNDDQPIICGNRKRDTNTLAGNSSTQLKAYLARAYYNRGLSYAVIGDNEKSLSDYKIAFQLDPEIDSLCIGLGNFYAYKAQYNPAIQNLDRAIGVDPKSAVSYNNLGNVYANQDDYQRSLEKYNEAIRLMPDSADVYYNRARLYLKQKQYNLALKDFDEAIKRKPNFADAYIGRGDVFLEQRDPDKAITEYQQATQANPNDAEAYLKQASVYQSQNNLAQAAQSYEQARQNQPQGFGSTDDSLQTQLETFYADRGNNLYREGDFQKAITEYSQSIRINPENSELYFARGFSYYQNSDHQAAIKDFNEAIRLNQKFAYAYYGLGISYLGAGDNFNARSNLQRFLEMTKNLESLEDPKDLKVQDLKIPLSSLRDSAQTELVNPNVNRERSPSLAPQ